MQEKIRVVNNPIDLLTHKRLDVVIKYLYASNLSSKYYKDAYKEHIRVWNNFCENKTSGRKKSGFESFDNIFKSIINNIIDY